MAKAYSMNGYYLTLDGRMIKSKIAVENRVMQSHKQKEAWLMESEPHFVSTSRGKSKEPFVFLTGEHATPVRPPWKDPRAATPEHNAFFRERNRQLLGLIAKKGSRTDLLLTINMLILGGVGLLFALVTILTLDFGAVTDKLPSL